MNYEERVKEILSKSIMELVQNKNIAYISVKDIVSNSDISRATFYRYFKDKYELMNWVFQKELNKILSDYPTLDNWKEVTYETLNYIYMNKQYFANIARYKNQNSVIHHIQERTQFYFISRLEKKYGKNLPIEINKAIDFYCAGIVYLLDEWIEHDMNVKPAVLTDWLCEFIPKILEEAIKI